MPTEVKRAKREMEIQRVGIIFEISSSVSFANIPHKHMNFVNESVCEPRFKLSMCRGFSAGSAAAAAAAAVAIKIFLV